MSANFRQSGQFDKLITTLPLSRSVSLQLDKIIKSLFRDQIMIKTRHYKFKLLLQHYRRLALSLTHYNNRETKPPFPAQVTGTQTCCRLQICCCYLAMLELSNIYTTATVNDMLECTSPISD